MVVTIKTMIARLDYITSIKDFIDKPQIKVLSGIRRSGKSTVLKLLGEELVIMGKPKQNIISINMESFVFADLIDFKAFYNYVKKKITKEGRYYLLTDEIQEVEGWEKAVNALLVDFDIDIYLTGSNAKLLSSELSTYLAGRYVEIPVFTLSFEEFNTFRKHYFKEDYTEKSFENYLRLGGFPVIHTTNYTLETAYKVVYDIYSSVILRDAVQRNGIRDLELLERVVKFSFDNVGKTFSGKSVADYFKNQQRKLDINTVYNYLAALESAFVLYRVSRYDLKGKEILKTQEKFFVGDISLIYATMGFRDRKISGILENIVFLELKRRGYQVFVGKMGTKEIDFVAEKKDKKIYVQVAYKLESEETVEREFSVLKEVKDNFPKFVVTMDEFWKDSIDGIKHIHIADFLLSDEY